MNSQLFGVIYKRMEIEDVTIVLKVLPDVDSGTDNLLK